MVYTHLTVVERYQIFSLIQTGHTPAFIARHLGRDPSTIYRELKRNQNPGARRARYSPSRADYFAQLRMTLRSRRRRIGAATWALVEGRLRCRRSPEQISVELLRQGIARISHEWIYLHIRSDKRKGGDLWTFLRGKLRRGWRRRTQRRRGSIIGRVGIEQRARIANERGRRGDYEIDTVFGKGAHCALVTIVDRRTRFLIVEKVPSKHADVVAAALIRGLRRTGRRVHTITSDNGTEFAHHRHVAKALAAKFYFANPYASWERGTNENTNGLLRQYFPRSRDFSTITQEEIDFAVQEFNDRPRKVLGFKSPNELFFA